MNRAILALPTLLAPLYLGACGPDAGSATAGRWEALVDTVADTVVVRTVAGSAWGDTMVLVPEVSIGVLDGAEPYMFGQIAGVDVDPGGRIWVVDRQVPEVRVFAPDGTHEMTAGRPGQGPGELAGPDGGFAVLSDGRALVRDPNNGRIQLYGPDGEPAGTWTLRGNFSTSDPLWRDREEHVYTQILMDPEAQLSDWRMGLVRIAPDGSPVDTLSVPRAEAWEASFVEARSENSWSRSSVPFAPAEDWALHPDGYFVHGTADDYSFTLLRPADEGRLPLRIERTWEPVPVTAGERAEEERRITQNFRSSFPDWRWNGPPIPDQKPPFRSIEVGRDGRIWIRVSLPSRRVEDPDHDPADPESVPDEWREDTAFDVFDPDGTYLGHVRTPVDFSLYPTPVFDGDVVVAVTRDELGVQRVVRYRLVPSEEASQPTG